MDQDKFGQLIRDIRKKHNLTQKDLADKYNVSYQAVSKWETGKNMPDMYLIKQISKDFNISLDNMLSGNSLIKNKYLNPIIIGVIVMLLIISSIFIYKHYFNNDFKFMTLSSNCDNFTISGSLAYNRNKSAIYISNIKYCGGNDTESYKEVECTLYDSHDNVNKKISSYTYQGQENVTLEEFLEQVTFSVPNYFSDCSEDVNNHLYLAINAKNNEDKVTTYKIPLNSNTSCSK